MFIVESRAPCRVRSGSLNARWAWHICQFQHFEKRYWLFPRIKIWASWNRRFFTCHKIDSNFARILPQALDPVLNALDNPDISLLRDSDSPAPLTKMQLLPCVCFCYHLYASVSFALIPCLWVLFTVSSTFQISSGWHLDNTGFKASNGWLHCWKVRNKIKQRKFVVNLAMLEVILTTTA